jgi:hypothetical protein
VKGKPKKLSTPKDLVDSHSVGTSVTVVTYEAEMEFGVLHPKEDKDFISAKEDHEWTADSTIC